MQELSLIWHPGNSSVESWCSGTSWCSGASWPFSSHPATPGIVPNSNKMTVYHGISWLISLRITLRQRVWASSFPHPFWLILLSCVSNQPKRSSQNDHPKFLMDLQGKVQVVFVWTGWARRSALHLDTLGALAAEEGNVPGALGRKPRRTTAGRKRCGPTVVSRLWNSVSPSNYSSICLDHFGLKYILSNIDPSSFSSSAAPSLSLPLSLVQLLVASPWNEGRSWGLWPKGAQPAAGRILRTRCTKGGCANLHRRAEVCLANLGSLGMFWRDQQKYVYPKQPTFGDSIIFDQSRRFTNTLSDSINGFIYQGTDAESAKVGMSPAVFTTQFSWYEPWAILNPSPNAYEALIWSWSQNIVHSCPFCAKPCKTNVAKVKHVQKVTMAVSENVYNPCIILQHRHFSHWENDDKVW